MFFCRQTLRQNVPFLIYDANNRSRLPVAVKFVVHLYYTIYGYGAAYLIF